jgi:hypothetical protein
MTVISSHPPGDEIPWRGLAHELAVLLSGRSQVRVLQGRHVFLRNRIPAFGSGDFGTADVISRSVEGSNAFV